MGLATVWELSGGRGVVPIGVLLSRVLFFGGYTKDLLDASYRPLVGTTLTSCAIAGTDS